MRRPPDRRSQLVDGIDVQDHSLPPRINIVMEAGNTNPAVIGNGRGHAIELSAKKRGAGSNEERIVKKNAVLRSNSCRADPADFRVSIDNNGRSRIGIILQEDKIIAQAVPGSRG